MGKRRRATAVLRQKVDRDVELVKNRAAAIISFLDGKAKINWNTNSSLAVIAIVGRGSAFGSYFPEAVLDEIGMHGGRPFHQAKVPFFLRQPGISPNIAYRSNIFRLAADQYEAIAPLVFELLQELTDRWVGRRQYGLSNPYRITRKFPYRLKNGMIGQRVRKIEVFEGCRFAVSANSYFAHDVYWAELNTNLYLRHFLEGLGEYIDSRLSEARARWKGEKDFLDLAIVKRTMRYVRNKKLLPHVFAELLEYLPGGRKNRFRQDVAHLLGVNGEQIAERKMSCSGLPDPQSRLGNIQIEVVGGLDRNLDHIAFEVFPSVKSKEYEIQPEFEDEPDDPPDQSPYIEKELPF